MGGKSPFSVEEQEPALATFPVASKAGLTGRQAQIYDRATEHAMEIELDVALSQLGTQGVRRIEEYTTLSFLYGSNRLAQWLEAYADSCPNSDIRDLQIVFANEGARRMGAAMAAIADTGEGGIQDVIGRPLTPEETLSVLERLFPRFSRRRRY